MNKRIGVQRYDDVAALVAEANVANDANDLVVTTAERKIFIWVPASTETHDGIAFVEQTADASGRFHAVLAAKGKKTGSGVTAAIANASQEVVTVTVTGVLNADSHLVKVTNNDALATAGLEVINAYVSADNTVKVVLYNTLGTNIAAGLAVDVAVLSF